jgi:PAS domain-containing protein
VNGPDIPEGVRVDLLLDGLPGIVFSVRLDPRPELLYANSSLERLLGYAPGEVVGDLVLSLFVPELLSDPDAPIGAEPPNGFSAPIALRTRAGEASGCSATGSCTTTPRAGA